MDMIEYLQRFLESDDTKLIYILALILSANLIDFTIGWLNAKFNKKVDFSSAKAIFGIARKLILFIVLVYAIPVALLMPEPLGISALYVLYIGYLLSEINSILNHFKLADDDKSMDPFIEFFKGLMRKGDK
ncbi:phage holin family protein [Metasolibacillus sp.]|uniref:phage holin family protein n=1 Tax=Metasolibacillus sp. TaxID=2703680 RepID=UPI0025EB94C7|nr:phage holin family protein [Metasolibacillus sp.]MCT6925411.1 phage holin family protein [Metasolibacillus sp.]MCT6941562.1 phage holin family protein [Metasolibacillus sp.]